MRVALLVVVLAAGLLIPLHAQAPVIIAVDDGRTIEPIARVAAAGIEAMPSSGLGRLAPRGWTRLDPDGRTRRIRLGLLEPAGRCDTPRRLPVANEDATRAPVAALAASGEVSHLPVRSVSARSAESDRLRRAVEGIFERRARDHGVAVPALARVAAQIDHAYAVGQGRDAAYYVETSKRLADAGNTPDEDPRGIVRVTVAAFLRTGGEGLVPAGTQSELRWEQEDAPATPAAALSPLGVIRHAAERIWIMRDASGAGQVFSAYALGDGAVRHLFTVPAAAC